MILSSCGSNVRQKSPEELRMELKILEQSSPLDYVKIAEGASMNPNQTREAGLFRDAEYDGYILNGAINNTATIAKFKDVTITIEFFSTTETLMEQKEHVFYEYYEPNSSKTFSLKIDPPADFDKFSISIKSATATE